MAARSCIAQRCPHPPPMIRITQNLALPGSTKSSMLTKKMSSGSG
jgi:hypothetical protein